MLFVYMLAKIFVAPLITRLDIIILVIIKWTFQFDKCINIQFLLTLTEGVWKKQYMY